VTVPVRLDEFRLAKLDELAAAEGKTRSQVMREALDGRIAAV
jgi:predicted transcriptional regulator